MTTPLHEAVRDGDVDEVRKLLNKGANPLARDKYGDIPSFYAFEMKHKPEIYASLVARHPEVLDDDLMATPPIQDMPRDDDKLAFLNALKLEIESLPVASKNKALEDTHIKQLLLLLNELNYFHEYGYQGVQQKGGRRLRRQGRGRKTVKARKALKKHTRRRR